MSARAQPRRAGGSAAAPRPSYRLRPAPRGSGPRSTRIRWDKAGRVALVLVLFLILALYIRPVIGFVEAWHQNGSEQATLEQLRTERAELDQRAAELQLPDADEVRARELGMVRAGEQAYSVERAKSGD